MKLSDCKVGDRISISPQALKGGLNGYIIDHPLLCTVLNPNASTIRVGFSDKQNIEPISFVHPLDHNDPKLTHYINVRSETECAIITAAKKTTQKIRLDEVKIGSRVRVSIADIKKEGGGYTATRDVVATVIAPDRYSGLSNLAWEKSEENAVDYTTNKNDPNFPHLTIGINVHGNCPCIVLPAKKTSGSIFPLLAMVGISAAIGSSLGKQTSSKKVGRDEALGL